MSLFSPLLVVCLDQEQVAAVTAIADALGFSDAHIVAGGFSEATQALTLRTTSPDYLIIDVGTRTSEVLPLLDEFAQHCEAGVRVVVTGTSNDIHFYRELKQRGVLEYFTHPIQPGEVRAVLIKPAANHQQMGTPTPGAVISCMSAASGDGSSTIALNLAYALASQYKQPTVLVDMDYQFGLICKSLDLAAPFGIRELFDHPDRGLDDMLVSKMLVNYRDTLSIIAAPSDLHLLPNIRPAIIRELVTILRSKFRFVILDVPHVWTDWTAAALTYSDHTAMIAQLWLRSLTHASRLLGAWHAVGVNRDHISMVINRSGAKFKEAINVPDFERICRHKIDAFINNDVKAVTYAEDNAQTLFESEHGTLLKQEISDMARKLVVRYVGADAANIAPETAAKKSLLNFPKKRKE